MVIKASSPNLLGTPVVDRMQSLDAIPAHITQKCEILHTFLHKNKVNPSNDQFLGTQGNLTKEKFKQCLINFLHCILHSINSHKLVTISPNAPS